MSDTERSNVDEHIADDDEEVVLRPPETGSRVTSPLVDNPPQATSSPSVKFADKPLGAANTAPETSIHSQHSPFLTSPATGPSPSRRDVQPPIHPSPTKSSLTSRAPFHFGRMGRNDSPSPAEATDSPTGPAARKTRTAKSLSIEAAQASHIVLQQEAIKNLLTAIKQKPAYIFKNAKLNSHPYLHPNLPQSNTTKPRSEYLLDLYYSLYPEGFINFDKNTYEILSLYLDACATVFDVLLATEDKTLSIQARLLTIALVFGSDRTLTALKINDRLMQNFQYTPEDYFHNHIYDKPELLEKAPNIEFAREHYAQYFRTDYYDIASMGEMVHVPGLHGKTDIPVIHHSFNTPTPRDQSQQQQRTFFAFPDPQQQSDSEQEQQHQHSRQYQQQSQQQHQQQRSKSHHQQEHQYQDQYQHHQHQSHQRSKQQHESDSDQQAKEDFQRRQKEYDKAFFKQTDSDDQPRHRHRPTGKSSSKCKETKHKPPRSSIGKPRQSYRTNTFDSPEYDSSSSSDSDDFDPRQPRNPLYFTPVEEFHGDRLSSAGKVYHPGQYKKKSRKSVFIDSIAKNISQLGLTEEQQAATLGTSLGVAHSINALTKE